MDITPLIPTGRQIIQSYGDGGFRISGTRHEGSVLIFPVQTLLWPVVEVEAMTEEALAAVALAEPKVEILLLGTGARLRTIPAALRRSLRGLGVAVDVMDTGAACRTYNVLLAEERRVAAALIAV
jgi:uncharacterized protein